MVETYNSIKCMGMVQASAKTDLLAASRETADAGAASFKQQASSSKLQAASLTAGEGYYRMDLERNNYDYKRRI